MCRLAVRSEFRGKARDELANGGRKAPGFPVGRIVQFVAPVLIIGEPLGYSSGMGFPQQPAG